MNSDFCNSNFPKQKKLSPLTNTDTYLVSTRIWRSNDNCRKRKNVRIDLLARSTSPHGNLFVKSIPVNGVTVGGKSKDASDITKSTLGGPILEKSIINNRGNTRSSTGCFFLNAVKQNY